MSGDQGNRGQHVQGVRYGSINPIEDQLAFDRLPATVRKYLISVPVRLSAIQIERLLEDGQSERSIIANCEKSVERFLANAEAEKQNGVRL